MSTRDGPTLNEVVDRGKEYVQIERADARIRTADPIITSDVLYQLSYVGLGSAV